MVRASWENKTKMATAMCMNGEFMKQRITIERDVANANHGIYILAIKCRIVALLITISNKFKQLFILEIILFYWNPRKTSIFHRRRKAKYTHKTII